MKIYKCVFCEGAVSGCQSGEINESADCTAGNYRVQLEHCCVKPGRSFKLTSIVIFRTATGQVALYRGSAEGSLLTAGDICSQHEGHTAPQ